MIIETGMKIHETFGEKGVEFAEKRKSLRFEEIFPSFSQK